MSGSRAGKSWLSPVTIPQSSSTVFAYRISAIVPRPVVLGLDRPASFLTEPRQTSDMAIVCMARILILEDDFFVRTLLVSALSTAGHETVEAVDGLQCLELVKKRPIGLAIIDLFVPERSGLEVMSELRRDYPDLPIVAISGKGKRYLQQAHKMGASVIKKPFSVPRLLEFIAMRLCRF